MLVHVINETKLLSELKKVATIILGWFTWLFLTVPLVDQGTYHICQGSLYAFILEDKFWYEFGSNYKQTSNARSDYKLYFISDMALKTDQLLLLKKGWTT